MNVMPAASKTITFILPLHAKRACGGVKVVFEYANMLVADGWKVVVAMSAAVLWRRMSFIGKIRALPYYLYCILEKSNRYPTWFKLDKRIKCISIPLPLQFFIPKSNVYIACGAEIAEYAKTYTGTAKKYYLIQGLDLDKADPWEFSTYQYPLQKLVVSRWLANVVKKHSANDPITIRNGFDTKLFRIKIPIEARSPKSLSVMYHPSPDKGFDTAMKAIAIARQTIPDLKVKVFGAYSPPANLPLWVEYFKSPHGEALVDIYNSSAIYVAASRSEGWGLTVGEAMLCGCAVCCTDCLGFLEMAENGHNALISPIDNTNHLAQNIIQAITNTTLREQLSQQAIVDMSNFTWEDSYATFLSAITQCS